MLAKYCWALVALCALAYSPRGINGNPIKTLKSGTVATEFLVLHNNDMHARFEQTSQDSTKCLPEEANSNKCYGGFARVAYEVRKYRNESAMGGMEVFYLNAGDTYTGTPWFTVYKDNITAAFLNKLMPDAISLGNHEFDEKVEGLVPFLDAVEFPVLAANLDLNKVPVLQASHTLGNSTILTTKNGVRVGVIGYLTPETKFLVSPNDVEYRDEIVAINEEAARLTAAGVKIIIALGHSGYLRDQEIAAGCPDVDVVIGGHTNTFLYNGAQPDRERIDGPYPTVVKQKNGKQVPVVQAYAYTKYLGKLHLQFDAAGDLLEFDGTPILLNAAVPAEDDVLQLLDVYRPAIVALENSIVGHTKVHLEGRAEICRKRECNLGNLITDSWIYQRVLEDMGGLYWTDAAIAFMCGGGIRSSIVKRTDGSVTENDILTVLTFQNNLILTQVTGATIRKALEHSATMYEKDSNGGFLQMSGVHVTYDYGRAAGDRVVEVEVRCAHCDVPKYEALNNTRTYSVLVTEFLYEGGDGHVFHESGGSAPLTLKANENDALIHYFQNHEFVYPEEEGRIVIRSGVGTAALAHSLLALTAALVAKRFW